jgi:hypothetical protein
MRPPAPAQEFEQISINLLYDEPRPIDECADLKRSKVFWGA